MAFGVKLKLVPGGEVVCWVIELLIHVWRSKLERDGLFGRKEDAPLQNVLVHCNITGSQNIIVNMS